jgi:cardiolipin synthase
VHVHVLIDAVGGSRIDSAYIEDLRQAGAQVVFYHALKWFDIGSAARINNRTHRKLLVLDGTVAFTGGVGIADEWQGQAQDAEHWRDTHYRVEGPVVGQLQAAFMDTWMQETGEVLHDGSYFPALKDTGTIFAQFFMSSYRGGSESMHLMYLLSIAGARRSIRLCSPYFIPEPQTIGTLLEARKRGVRIQIILPGPVMDEEIVRKASRSRWGELLAAGVEIYEYQPTMFHCKLMIVDEFWTSVGSSNLDNRSFSLNDEANLNVLDAAFAAQQARMFEADLTHCRPITYEAWSGRSAGDKIQDAAASLMGPQL